MKYMQSKFLTRSDQPLTKKDLRDEVFFDIYENHEQLIHSRSYWVHGIRVEWLLHLTTQVNLMLERS